MTRQEIRDLKTFITLRGLSKATAEYHKVLHSSFLTPHRRKDYLALKKLLQEQGRLISCEEVEPKLFVITYRTLGA